MKMLSAKGSMVILSQVLLLLGLALPAAGQVSITNRPAPGTVGLQYSFQFGTSPAASYNFSCNCANPAPGLSLSASGAITGSPTQSGTFAFSVTATDPDNSEDTSGPVAMSIKIAPQPLTILTNSAPNGTVGAQYATQLNASGGSGTYAWSLFSGSLPPTLSLSSSGLISGVLTIAGQFTFRIQATDSSSSVASQPITTTVSNIPLSLAPDSVAAGQVNGSYSQKFVGSGGNGGPYTYSMSGSVPGLNLNPSSGVLAGILTTAGTFTFSVGVSDGSTFTPAYPGKSYSLSVYPLLTISPGTIPAADAGSPYSQSFKASGGSGSGYVYSINTLPSGLSLNATTGVLSGIPGSSGSFTISAHDSAGLTGSQTYGLSVNPALVLSPASGALTGGQQSVSFTQSFTAVGGSGSYTYILGGQLPPGLTFNAGTLTGTPTASGTFTFSVTVRDALGYAVVNTYSLAVANPPITVLPATIAQGQVGTPYSQTFTASGGNNGPYTFSIGAPAPFGLTFNPATATLSGTPTSYGTASISISASDGTVAGKVTVAITVTPAAVTLSPSSLPGGALNTAYSQSFSAAGGLGTYTFTVTGTPPPGLTFTASGNTYTLSGSPTAAGTYAFSVKVSDGTNSATQNVSVTINNPPITLSPASVPPGMVGSAYSQSFAAAGGNGGPYTYSLSGAVPGLTLNTSTGQLSGNPTTGNTYSFTIGVSDGSPLTPAFAGKTFSLTIYPSLVLVTQALPSADLQIPYSQSFGAAGGSGSGYSYSTNNPPPGLTLSGAGVLSGQPTATGTFPFTVTVKDGAGFIAAQNFTLVVNAAVTVSPPTLSSAQAGTSYSQAFTASGGSGNYTFTFTGTAIPGMSFSSGTLSGTPTFAGNYAFSIAVKDSLGATASATYTLNVTNPPITLAPPALPPGIVGSQYTQAFQASGGNGGPYTYSLTGTPGGPSLLASTGVLTGLPTAPGSYTFSIGVSDGSAFTPAFTPKSYTLTIYPGLSIGPAAVPNADLQVPYSQTFAVTGGSGVGYTYAINAAPAGLNFSAATGVLSGAPAASGSFPFTITAKDGAGFTGTQSYTLNVNQPLTLSPSSLPGAQVSVGYSQSFTASGGSGGYTYSVSPNAPAGLTLNSGVLSGVPTASGTFPFSVAAKDTLGGTVTNNFSLVIANPPIVVQPATIASGQVGVAYSQTFSATGGNNGPYTFSFSGTAPFGLTFSGATLSGNPTSYGTAPVTISATDGTITGQRTYSLTISPPGLTISPATLAAGTVNVPYSQVFTAGGGQGNYTLTLTSPAPAGLTFVASGGSATLSGTPTVYGSFTISVQVADASSTFARTYTLVISPASVSVTTTNLPDGTQGQTYSQKLSAAGGAPPYTWSAPGNSLPPGLSLASDGNLTGSFTAAGSFKFTVTVTDSLNASASGVVNLVVQPSALIILTTSPLPPAVSGIPYSVTLNTSGGTPPYQYSLNSGPPGLALNGNVLSGTMTNAGALPVTYTVSISVTDHRGQSIGAGFEVRVQPAAAGIILSAGSLAFTAISGGSAPPPNYVSVSSTTPASINFTASSNQGWLTVSPGSGTTPATLQVGVNPTGLTAGNYNATLTVTGPDGPHAVVVTLTIKGLPPSLNTAPTLVSFSTDGVTPPAPGAIQITNAGTGTLTYTASVVNGSPWLSLGSSPGSVDAGTPVTIAVNISIAGLAPGAYRDVVHIDSPAGTSDIPVTLLVAGAATINLTPAGTTYSSRQGQGLTNATRSFQVQTTGANPVTWTADAIGGSGWLTINTPSGSSMPGNPGTVSFSVDPSKLSAADYYARVRVTAPGASNSPQDFLVVSTVAPVDTLAVPDPTPAGLLFISSPGSPVPPAQNLQVGTSSNTPSNFSVAANTNTGGNWLSITPANGITSSSAPGQVRATVNATGLAPGVYMGGISFTLSSNPTAVRTVNAVLIVTGGSGASPTLRTLDQHNGEVVPELTAAAGCTPTRLVAIHTGLVSNFSTPAGWPTPLAVQLADDCGAPVTTGQVIATFSTGDAPLALQVSDQKNAVYSATWTPRGASSQVTVTARATAPALQAATAQIVGSIAANKVPILFKNGTIHNMNPQAGAPLAPGTIVQIYGTGLAAAAQQTSLPLPTNVGGTTVIVGGIEAPLYYVSDGQLNAELPLELTPGRQYQILVSSNGALTSPDTVVVQPATPGVAALGDGTGIAQHADSSYVTAASPAAPGEILTIYLAGMGLTDVGVKTGQQSPSSPLAHPTIQPSMTLNGEPVTISFAGLTPQAVGLYQINFQVPADAPAGNLKLLVSQGNAQSNVATIPVQPAPQASAR